MKRTVLALAALALLATTAHAEEYQVRGAVVISDQAPVKGLLCAFVVYTDVLAEEGVVNGVLFGGPVQVSGGDGTLSCRLQITVADHAGAGPAAVGHSTAGVGTAGPQIVNMTVPVTEPLYLCAEFTKDTGTTLYWDAPAARWSTSISVTCTLASIVVVPLP